MARDALGVVAMTDMEACLVSLSDWIGALAEDVARSEGIVPPDRHRMVNFFMRTWLAEHGVAADERHAMKFLAGPSCSPCDVLPEQNGASASNLGTRRERGARSVIRIAPLL